MTKAEKQEIAEMTAAILRNGIQSLQNGAGEAKAPAPLSESIPVITTSPSGSQGVSEHKASISPDQVQDILNDVRMEVRIQNKYPLIEALEQAFRQSPIKANINGKTQPLISLETMGMIIDHLKSNGKYWPSPVVSVLNEDGQRLYMNSSFKREDGDKWQKGGLIKFKAPQKQEITLVVQQ